MIFPKPSPTPWSFPRGFPTKCAIWDTAFQVIPCPKATPCSRFWRSDVEEGVRERYLPKENAELFEKARQQAQRELALIGQLELAGYFLIVWDIVQFCKTRKHSCAGSRIGGEQRGVLCTQHHGH